MASKNQASKRTLILDTAIRMFLKQGVSKTSIDQIASAAKVSKITVYNYFGNKEALFIAGLEQVNKRVIDKLPKVDSLEGDAYSKLVEFSLRVVSILAQPDTVALFRVIVSEAEHHPQVPINFLQYVKIPLMNSFSQLLSTLDFNKSVIAKPEIGAEIFFGILKERVLWPLLLKLKVQFTSEELEAIAHETITGLLLWSNSKSS